MKIIPAIDIIDGKCVRLVKGDYNRLTVYADDPLEVAKRFEDHGIRYLHLVDLDGARTGKVVNAGVLEKIATHTSLHIDFGGGVKSDADIQTVFDSGASQVTAGSMAVKNPEKVIEWLYIYGPEKIILGADVKDGQIAVSGWRESGNVDLWNFLESYYRQGIRHVISTDVSKDGMLQGPAIDMYRRIIERFPRLQVIASGGVTTLEDVEKLRQTGVAGVIIGKAIYENKITLKDLERYVG